MGQGFRGGSPQGAEGVCGAAASKGALESGGLQLPREVCEGRGAAAPNGQLPSAYAPPCRGPRSNEARHKAAQEASKYSLFYNAKKCQDRTLSEYWLVAF